jgi:hypothetical protein
VTYYDQFASDADDVTNDEGNHDVCGIGTAIVTSNSIGIDNCPVDVTTVLVQSSAAVSSYVIAHFKAGKRIKHYIGKAIPSDDNHERDIGSGTGTSIQVSFLRQTKVTYQF